MKAYNHPIPKELVKHVTAICGAKGTAWLDDLPRTIGLLEEKWKLTVEAPFPPIEFNFVAPATRENGDLAVLKIAPPYGSTEIFGEAKFLSARNGEGCIRVMDLDRQHHSILIERALPGQNFTEIFADDPFGCVEPAVSVLHSVLRRPPRDLSDTISLNDWFDGLRRYEKSSFPARYAEKALNIYSELSKQSEHIFYLHGDYHPGNIVNATREPYLVIDAKGIIGHIGYEIAVFLNNLHWWRADEPDIKERLDAALAKFSVGFGINEKELEQWAFAGSVLGHWWTFDEMRDIYSGGVLKSDIWDV